MYAKTTLIQFKSGAVTEAIHIIRDIMLPTASTQQGFKGATLLKSATQMDMYTIISLWETKAAMDASGPPEHIQPDLARLSELTASVTQDTCEVLFQLDSSGVNI